MAEPTPNKRASSDSANSDGPRKRPKYDYDNLVTIVVGHRKDHFRVHKDVLCSKSRYFARVCSHDSNNVDGEMIVEQLKVSEPFFSIYVSWAYTAKLVIDAEDEQLSGPNRAAWLLNMYYLGLSLDDRLLRNEALKQLIPTLADKSFLDIHLLPGDETLQVLYKKTKPGCPLRKVIVEWSVLNSSRENFVKRLTRLPTEFVQDVALSLMHRTPVAASDSEAMHRFRNSYEPEVETA